MELREFVQENELIDPRSTDLVENYYKEYSVRSEKDMLSHCFSLQASFMEMLRADGRFPKWPLDLSSKEEQRQLQTYLWDTVREISEASAALKNRIHRVKEEPFMRQDFLEEMGDAFAFFMESLLLAGFTAEDLYKEYKRKNFHVTCALLTKER